MSPRKACVFCAIVRHEAPASIVFEGGSFVAFHPLNPHAPGHVLFVPRQHVERATTNVAVTAAVVEAAATYAAGLPASNIIMSSGKAATQTVEHLHVHVVPRGPHDHLEAGWPWWTPAGEPLCRATAPS